MQRYNMKKRPTDDELSKMMTDEGDMKKMSQINESIMACLNSIPLEEEAEYNNLYARLYTQCREF